MAKQMVFSAFMSLPILPTGYVNLLRVSERIGTNQRSRFANPVRGTDVDGKCKQMKNAYSSVTVSRHHGCPLKEFVVVRLGLHSTSSIEKLRQGIPRRNAFTNAE
jgi:hypothetical protein